MSHKVDPRVYRIKGINDWKSRGFYKDAAKSLEEDFKIREYIDKKIGRTGVEKVEIERFPGKINVLIHSARPGLIIGRGGEGIEQMRKELEKILKEPLFSAIFKRNQEKLSKKEKKQKKQKEKKGEIVIFKTDSDDKAILKIDIKEVRDPWVCATLAAQWLAQRLEKRIPFRKAIKEAMSKIVSHKEIKGARIEVSGRLNGAEIARREWFGAGQLPRQTLRADIDYAKDEAHCTYGAIGIKVWIYKGEKFE